MGGSSPNASNWYSSIVTTTCCFSWSLVRAVFAVSGVKAAVLPVSVAAEAGARVGVEAGARVGDDVAARGGADVGARSSAERSAADGDGREATEVDARVAAGLDVRDTAVGRALVALPPALSASVLTRAVAMQRCTFGLITVPAFCVRPARASPGGWLVHRAARRYWAAVGDGTGAGAGAGVGAVVGAGVGIGCTAASSTMARRVEYDSQRC